MSILSYLSLSAHRQRLGRPNPPTAVKPRENRCPFCRVAVAIGNNTIPLQCPSCGKELHFTADGGWKAPAGKGVS